MKKIIFALVSLALLVSCTEENVQPVKRIDPLLESYVNTFYSEAAERGVSLSENIIAELRDNVQGISEGNVENGQYTVYISRTIFDEFNRLGMQDKIEAMIAYRMATIFLHAPEPEVVIHPQTMEFFPAYNREATFDGWF